MQSRIDFLEQSILALDSVLVQTARLKDELNSLHQDCLRLKAYGIESNQEMDKQIVEAFDVLDELVDSYDNILAKPGDDIKTQRETDYRYSRRNDAKTVEQSLQEHELALV